MCYKWALPIVAATTCGCDTFATDKERFACSFQSPGHVECAGPSCQGCAEAGLQDRPQYNTYCALCTGLPKEPTDTTNALTCGSLFPLQSGKYTLRGCNTDADCVGLEVVRFGKNLTLAPERVSGIRCWTDNICVPMCCGDMPCMKSN